MGHRSSRLGLQYRVIYRTAPSSGESVRIIGKFQGLSQTQLAQRTGIPQATLCAIENDRVRLGVEQAKVLAKATPMCASCGRAGC